MTGLETPRLVTPRTDRVFHAPEQFFGSFTARKSSGTGGLLMYTGLLLMNATAVPDWILLIRATYWPILSIGKS